MIKLSMLSVLHPHRLAALAVLCAAPAVAVSGQTIGLNAGTTGSTIIAPNAKLTVPIIIDFSTGVGMNIAGLQSSFSWGAARLTLDSIRAVTIPGWSFTPNTINAPSGSSLFATFGNPALTTTTTIANAFFTASASTGGTRIVLAPSAAASDVGANILNALRPRSLDVCVGTAAKWGDVNDDGIVNISDAQQIGRFSVGLSVVNPAALAARGDVTADGLINISDAQQVARFSVGLSASPRLGTDLPSAAPTTAISISPGGAQTLVIGSSRQLNGTPVNGGTDLTGCAPVTWSTSNPARATVNSTGYVTAVSAGAVTITATSGSFSSQAAFTVTAVPVATVSLALAPTAIQIGSTSAATATMRDAANNVLTGRVVTFSSSNTSIATVNATTGVVTGVAAGAATIFATSEGITGSATVTVTTGVPTASVTVALGQTTINPGATTTATATPRDAGNNILGGKVITWSSSNTGVATVNPTTGVVTGVNGGTASIIATVDGIAGQATVTVNTVPVASVSVALGSSSIGVGATTMATATTRDASNNVLTGRVVTFTSNNSGVATVSSFTGLVTGVSAGTAIIFATSEGITGQTTVTVAGGGTVTSIQVSLVSSNIQSGTTTQANATLRDAGNNIISGPVTWSSSASSIASVNASTGVVSGLAAGNATITATSGSVQGQATVTITTTPVASVTAVLAPASITVGNTSTGTATTFDAGGNVLTGRVVVWSSTNTSVATVNSSTGIVTAVAIGTATIRATSESRIGSATITVGVTPVAQVSVTLGASTVAPGGSTTATAVTRDAQNNILTGRTVTWSSSNTARATVNATTGVVTAVSAGTVNIIGTSEGIQGTATLTVGTVTPATVTVSLGQGTIAPGGTTTAAAVVRDAGGNVLSGQTVSWTSSNTSVATVNSSTGVVTGVSVGTSTITGTSGSATGTTTVNVATVVSNEPTGMALLGQKAMNCVKPTACESDWGFWDELYPNSTILVSDPTAPRSSPNVVQMIYKPQLPGGSSPASVGKTLSQKQIIYVLFSMKLSSNYQGHNSGVNKKLHFFTKGGRNTAIFNIRGGGSGTLVPGFLLQGLAMPLTFTPFGGSSFTSTEQNLDANPNVCKTIRGQWHTYEMVLTNNTPGVADGRGEIWMDGVKCVDVSGIGFVGSGQNNKWEDIWWSPTWGGVNDAVAADFTESVDHLYISGK
jgi:uncharacterized protein YjdB